MNKRPILMALMAVLVLTAGAQWAQRDDAPAPAAPEGTSVVPLAGVTVKNPVVACTPYAYTTENEEDPFNADRIRRTRTTVTSVVLVHADGTTEIKRVTGG